MDEMKKADDTADEIERLRNRCEAYKGQVEAGAAEIAALKARVAELEAIEALKDVFPPPRSRSDYAEQAALFDLYEAAAAIPPVTRTTAMDEMTKALKAEDARQTKLQELLETIREQIRLEVLPEHRPEGLFQNIQNAVYAMRGRTPLMNDVVITSHLAAQPAAPVRDWLEETAHENGNYQCRCAHCGKMFIGHKRRVTCKACAAPLPSTQKVREKLELIACHHVTENPLWWQKLAREALAALSTNPGEQ